MKKKTKRLVYTRTPLQLTDLGLTVQGELQMKVEDLLRPYIRVGFPKDSLGLVLQNVVRTWRRK